jgi:hypothetical protein
MELPIITYEIGLKLKDLGFDINCGLAFDEVNAGEFIDTTLEVDISAFVMAPNIELAKRWLRLEENIDVRLMPTLKQIANEILAYYKIIVTNHLTKLANIVVNEEYTDPDAAEMSALLYAITAAEQNAESEIKPQKLESVLSALIIDIDAYNATVLPDNQITIDEVGEYIDNN